VRTYLQCIPLTKNLHAAKWTKQTNFSQLNNVLLNRQLNKNGQIVWTEFSPEKIHERLISKQKTIMITSYWGKQISNNEIVLGTHQNWMTKDWQCWLLVRTQSNQN
jgi:hypothetical protein